MNKANEKFWAQVRFKLIFEKQLFHYLVLVVLLTGIFIASKTEGFLSGQFGNISTEIWLYLAVSTAIIHQVYVWFFWRVELHHSLISRIFGEKGYTWYTTGFAILFLSRFIIIGLAISSRNSFTLLDPLILSGLAFFCIIPLAYLGYSMHQHFSYTRASGIDHFNEAYRNKPLVREGIFRYFNNPMYIFGLLIFWIPGLLCSSAAALAVALFYHLYIWAHYYFTEKPDMQRIYGV